MMQTPDSRARTQTSAGSLDGQARCVLVIGSQGVLGSLLARAFADAGWDVTRGGRRPEAAPDFRHVDLDEPETVATAARGTDLVVNPVPDPRLVAERIVLDRGGLLLNVSALPAAEGRSLGQRATSARGTVVMNAGIAPGITNLVAADLLAAHPEADEIELAFTVATRSTSGPAGGDFAHRNLTTLPRHRTALIPLPEPFGRRRCLGFAEPDAGWLGAVAAGRAVNSYVCLAERGAHRAMLALNAAGLMSRLPRAALGSAPSPNGEASREPVAHWTAVLERGRRIGARTLECRGDYRGAAESAVVFAQALLDEGAAAFRGVFGPEDLPDLDRLTPSLREVGISVVDRLGDREPEASYPHG
jgi:NAD(P)-dependent dehydrogenase (short-subunit alcohol dehydrogenase family)